MKLADEAVRIGRLTPLVSNRQARRNQRQPLTLSTLLLFAAAPVAKRRT